MAAANNVFDHEKILERIKKLKQYPLAPDDCTQMSASQLVTHAYQVVRVPPHLHQSWIDIAYQQVQDHMPQEVTQATTTQMLRNWFRAHYPDRKLCGFEEFTPAEVEKAKLPIEPGFYLKTRKMYPEEYTRALQVEAQLKEREAKRKAIAVQGEQSESNPRWELEGYMGHIAELREPNPQKYL